MFILPSYSRCDGSKIPYPSIWAGQKTPNINGEKRFLRGGLDHIMLEKQEDSLQSHTHGIHDPGHTHRYNDKYFRRNAGNGHDGPAALSMDKLLDRFDGTHWATSNRNTANVAVTSVVGARTDSETRPKNLAVVFIMKVF